MFKKHQFLEVFLFLLSFVSMRIVAYGNIWTCLQVFLIVWAIRPEKEKWYIHLSIKIIKYNFKNTFLIILSSSSICNGGFRKASKVSHIVGKRFLRSEYDFSGNDILIIIKPILKNVLTPTINREHKIEFREY